jgi:hypothetical protein
LPPQERCRSIQYLSPIWNSRVTSTSLGTNRTRRF